MPYRIVLRQDTSANWALNNPTLLSGEFGFETDTNQLKLGDGVLPWNSLEYYLPGPVGATGATGPQGNAGSSGTSGSSGSSGINGTSGSSGTSGSNGAGGALGYYGVFYDDTIQPIQIADTPQIVEIGSTVVPV